MHQGAHVHGFGIECLAARKGQHALGERGAALGARDGVVDEPHELGLVGQALAQQLQAAEDRHEQVVEVMGDAAGQLADRLHLL
jgi:hypothetical protein